MAKKWHKKHIGTQVGIAVLGFFLVATILSISVFQRSQDVLAVQTQSSRNAQVYLKTNGSRVNLQQDVKFDVWVSPANHQVSSVTFTLSYDRSKFQAIGQEFVVNNGYLIKEQTSSQGYYKATVEVRTNNWIRGNDRKIGTLTLLTIGEASRGTPVRVTAVSGLSMNSKIARDNVFEQTGKSLTISVVTPTPTPRPATPTPRTPTPTRTPTPAPRPSCISVGGICQSVPCGGRTTVPTGNYTCSSGTRCCMPI